MEIKELVQGTDEWHIHRKKYKNASEAPAMMAESAYVTRDEMLWRAKSGEEMEVTPYMEKIFARGHELEALARPIAEALIGETLYPVTGTKTVDGVDMSASFDGLTIDGEICWEFKTINNKLRAVDGVGQLPEMYKIQMDQQLAVSGAKSCLFMASDGTEDDMMHLWYETSLERIQSLVDGWKQFDIDLPDAEPPVTTRDDTAWSNASALYKSTKIALAAAQEAQEASKAALIELAGGVNSKGCGLSLTKVIRVGSVQYLTIPELNGLDLAPYRGKPSESYRITIEKDKT